MKTLAEVVAGFESNTLDGRDAARLARFVPEADLPRIGVALEAGAEGTHEPIPFTRENVLARLKGDVAFGFEKALNKRGISSGLMYATVMMWNRVLDEGLADWPEERGYAQYGLPLFRATAVKYGWDNPIGDDAGTEAKYASDW